MGKFHLIYYINMGAMACPYCNDGDASIYALYIYATI